MKPSIQSCVLLAGLCCAGLMGCAGNPEMDVPEGFLSLRASDGEFKATNTEDARIWIRQFEDRDQGSLEFWIEALTKDLTRNRGYLLTSSSNCRDSMGRNGGIRQFSLSLEGETFGYFIAVFVIPESSTHTIRTVEFLARTEDFRVHVDAVEKSIRTLSP